MAEDNRKMYSRAERPPGLHPLLSEVFDKWETSGFTKTEVANHIGVSPSALYGWFLGRGKPTLLEIDAMLNMFGYRLKVERGLRRVGGSS